MLKLFREMIEEVRITWAYGDRDDRIATAVFVVGMALMAGCVVALLSLPLFS